MNFASFVQVRYFFESDLGCGQRAVAARESFDWVIENDDTRIIPLLSDEDIRQMLDNEDAPEDEDKKP